MFLFFWRWLSSQPSQKQEVLLCLCLFRIKIKVLFFSNGSALGKNFYKGSARQIIMVFAKQFFADDSVVGK
jgi:hypothetical protein